MSTPISIRAAQRADVPFLFSQIVALAEYERAAERVTGSETLLEEALFSDRPLAEALIAEVGRGETAGVAIFYTTFSTWLCRPGIWLEDLFVLPERRRYGIGRALLAHLAALAQERGCGRVEWEALDWNTPAIEFYLGLGAKRLHDWEGFRLEGPALADLADRAG